MNIGVKMLWLLITALLTAGGLFAPVVAEKLFQQQTITQTAANAIGMIGIPLGLLGCVVFFSLFFIE